MNAPTFIPNFAKSEKTFWGLNAYLILFATEPIKNGLCFVNAAGSYVDFLNAILIAFQVKFRQYLY